MSHASTAVMPIAYVHLQHSLCSPRAHLRRRLETMLSASILLIMESTVCNQF